MTQPMDARQAHVHRLVIHNPGDNTVFVVRDAGWHLPELTLAEQHTAEVEHINAAVRAHWGIRTVVLAGLEHTQDQRGPRRAHALLAEPPGDAGFSAAREGTRAWLSLDAMARAGVPDEDVALAHAALATRHVIDGREWMRPGWWRDVREWIAARIGDADVVQTCAWESSCIARVCRRGETRPAFFFNALPMSAVREVRVTDYLSRLSLPGAPHVHAADLDRRWLLIRAVHGTSLEDDRDPGRWEHALATYGRLQAVTIDRVEELRALGCAERHLADLSAAIEPLFADVPALTPGGPDGLTPEEIVALQRLAVALHHDCEVLAAMAVPMALDHGDLWPSNILFQDSACTVIDWEDACISQPFLSLAPLLVMLREAHIDLPLERVTNVYLEAFRDRGAGIERAFALSVPLGVLDMAVRYWRVPMEVSALHPWMREMVPFFLRHLIDLRQLRPP